MEAGRYRPDIDGLRAVAILSVLAFHAFPDWIPGGFVGVDVFFVISGFLISRIIFSGLSAGTFRFAHFFERRVRRIFPSLAVILIAAIGAGAFTLLPSQYAELGKHVAAGAGFVSNIALWLESGYFDAAATSKPLLHLWSLGIEEQFYIAFPVLFYLAARFRVPRMPLLLSLGALSFGFNLFFTAREPSAAFYFPHTRFWELIAGCVLAQQSLASDWITLTARARDGVSLAGLGAIAAAIVLLDPARDFPGWWALLPVCGAWLIIWAGPSALCNRTLLSMRAMVWIGLISFQLYLWHWPLLAFLHIAGHGDDPRARALAVAASLPLAWATYAWVDKPIRGGGHGRAKAALACAALLLLATAGVAIFACDGFPGRFPTAARELATYHFDHANAYREGSCFLRPEQGPAEFRDCADARIEGMPHLFLWGDSHAAHLYPGLKAAAADHFSLTQMTASVCPPILGIHPPSRPHCEAIQDDVMARIVAEPPDEIVLAAHWPLYDWSTLPATIDRLAKAGIRHIVVVGPVPEWTKSLPALLSIPASDPTGSEEIPERRVAGLNPQTQILDTRLRDALKSLPVTYVSMLASMCNTQGCLVRTGDAASSITAWDASHLTSDGSIYAVAHFPPSAFPSRP
ncbi:MAG: acyltransferase family protein [Dokdonella sp.]|uniref:acyltransferase family protein n=1 Tax=Dokdonella sp. TaxID=2291710 RepID=UPI003264AFE9